MLCPRQMLRMQMSPKIGWHPSVSGGALYIDFGGYMLSLVPGNVSPNLSFAASACTLLLAATAFFIAHGEANRTSRQRPWLVRMLSVLTTVRWP